MVAKRFEVHLVDLNPTMGSEINKVRPCAIISPDQMNRVLNTVIIAPLTSTLKNYPMRVNCYIQGRRRQIALDHLRSVDKARLIKKVDTVDAQTQFQLVDTLQEMFAF